MASERATALMRAEATARVDAATATLAERFGVSFTLPAARHTDDPALRRARDLERTAALLEQIVAATAPPPAEAETEDVDHGESAPQQRRKGAA